MDAMLSLFLAFQKKRVQYSLWMFWIGIALFAVSAVKFYLVGASPIAAILCGVIVWSSSIVYHLSSAYKDILALVQEASK